MDEAKRLKKELLLFKVDFEKAYDSVDLNYLNVVMQNMNFPMDKGMCVCGGGGVVSSLKKLLGLNGISLVYQWYIPWLIKVCHLPMLLYKCFI